MVAKRKGYRRYKILNGPKDLMTFASCLFVGWGATFMTNREAPFQKITVRLRGVDKKDNKESGECWAFTGNLTNTRTDLRTDIEPNVTGRYNVKTHRGWIEIPIDEF